MFLFLCGPRQFCRVPCATWYLFKELVRRASRHALYLSALWRVRVFLFCLPRESLSPVLFPVLTGCKDRDFFCSSKFIWSFFLAPCFPSPLSGPRIPCVCGVQRWLYFLSLSRHRALFFGISPFSGVSHCKPGGKIRHRKRKGPAAGRRGSPNSFNNALRNRDTDR